MCIRVTAGTQIWVSGFIFFNQYPFPFSPALQGPPQVSWEVLWVRHVQCRTQGLLTSLLWDSDMIIVKYESREPDLTWRWRSDGHFPSVCPARGWTALKNLKEEAGGSYSSFEQFCQVGRASLDTEQIRAKWRYRAWSHPWPVSSLFSFLLASFLWQSAGNRPRWQSHWRASQLPGHRKSWSLWAISLQFAASLRPHVIKLSLWERVKKEKTTCDLTCWFPENRTLQGAEGKGTEAGGGTEVCNKDLSFSFQEVFKPAAPWGHHWNFFSLKGPWSQPLYGSVWSLSPLGFFLESSGTMYQARIKAMQSCFQKELILKETWSIA